MRVWITKYALSVGVMEFEAVESSDSSDTMITIRRGRYPENFHGKDWHRSREEAFADAERRRIAKIAALRKQIAKFEKMRFA